MRVMRLSKIAVLLMLLACMTACLEVNEVKVNGNPYSPDFKIEEPLYFGTGGSISLSEYDSQTNETKQIWLIEHTRNAKSISLSRVRYGELPEGFVTVTAGNPLKLGVIYVVYFYASGGARALGYFKNVREGDSIVLVNIDSHGNPN